jgi:hypothetical protein
MVKETCPHAAAADTLTRSGNRSSALLKLLAVLIVLSPLLFLCLQGLFFGISYIEGSVLIYICFCDCVFLFLCALFWMTADPSLLQKRPTGSGLPLVLRSGSAPTICYLLATMTAMFLGSGLTLSMMDPHGSGHELISILGMLTITMVYILYTTALARTIVGWLAPKNRTPGARRMFLVLLLVLNVTLIFGLFIVLQGSASLRHIPGSLAAFAPLLYITYIDDYCSYIPQVFGHMLPPGLLGLGYYIFGMRSTRRPAEPEEHEQRDHHALKQQDDDLMSMIP